MGQYNSQTQSLGGARLLGSRHSSRLPGQVQQPLRLDDAGIQRATVMSTAFWLASPRRKRVENERERIRAANDWVIRQTAEYPDRLIPFCGVNVLSDYSLEEMQRCASEPRVRGIKLHFANALVDLKNPEHLPKVKAFFRAANQSGMALVVHLWPRDRRSWTHSLDASARSGWTGSCSAPIRPCRGTGRRPSRHGRRSGGESR
jgi:predicted TIM-barrel fold metal-dependent hydrolase